MLKPTNLLKDLCIGLIAVAAVFSWISGELLITSTLVYLASLSSLLDFRIAVRT